MVEMATTPPVENIFESEDIAISHWDIHFYFFQTDVKDVESAQSIQAAFRARFPSIKTFDLVKEPVGPHPVGMWEAHLCNPSELGSAITWLSQHHKHHSVLVSFAGLSFSLYC